MVNSITRIAQQLRITTRANVSSIDNGQPIEYHPVDSDNIASLLGRLSAQHNYVSSSCINSRFVLFPTSLAILANTEVPHVVIKNVSRAEAAGSYFEHVRQITNHAIDVGIVLQGKLNTPMFEDLVTLSQQSTFLNHLVDLLGADRQIVFSLRMGPDRHWAFEFIHDPAMF